MVTSALLALILVKGNFSPNVRTRQLAPQSYWTAVPEPASAVILKQSNLNTVTAGILTDTINPVNETASGFPVIAMGLTFEYGGTGPSPNECLASCASSAAYQVVLMLHGSANLIDPKVAGQYYEHSVASWSGQDLVGVPPDFGSGDVGNLFGTVANPIGNPAIFFWTTSGNPIIFGGGDFPNTPRTTTYFSQLQAFRLKAFT